MDQSRPFLAALWMCGAVVSFVLMAVAGRAITVEMNTFELMFYRSVIGVGIVAKNGILMLDFVAQLRADGVGLEDALVRSGQLTFVYVTDDVTDDGATGNAGAARRTVRIGPEDHGLVEVISGLKNGDVVIVPPRSSP